MRRSTFIWSKNESKIFPWPSAATAKLAPGLQTNNSLKPMRLRFTAIQKAKRKGKKTGEESTVTEEIVVQRMSADISGKQQKYTRIGAQEYVPFEHEEMRTSKTPARSASGLRSKNILTVMYRLESAGHLAKRWPIFQTEKCSIYGRHSSV